jgi:hypothetical protein
MDDSLIELLSRYLDDDLSAAEADSLEERLRTDPELAAELAALEDLRTAVQRLADREEPPDGLDSLVEHLRRAAPVRPGLSPWVRWLGAAATLMLGLAVILEVNRRHPAPSFDQPTLPNVRERAPQPTERFSLAPLPTSSIPEEERPLGASDRLLASPVAEVEFDELPSLEVIGPLGVSEVEAHDPQSVSEATAGKATAAGDRAEARDVDAVKSAATAARPPTSSDERKRQSGRLDQAAEEGLQKPSAQDHAQGPVSWTDEKKPGVAQLFVFIDGQTAWVEFNSQTRCPPGRYIVRVNIVDGTVAEAWPLGGAPSSPPSQRLCSGEIVLGVEVANVPDGQYQGEVVVGSAAID